MQTKPRPDEDKSVREVVVKYHPSVFVVFLLVIFRILFDTMAMLIENSAPAMHE